VVAIDRAYAMKSVIGALMLAGGVAGSASPLHAQIFCPPNFGFSNGICTFNGRGFARIEPGGATLVVYAAKHGQIALDGAGTNSPFVASFVQRMLTPGIEINELFRLVRDDVLDSTEGRQEPFTSGSLPGREDFYFVGAR
jgi:uncharacterized caspase-like protein